MCLLEGFMSTFRVIFSRFTKLFRYSIKCIVLVAAREGYESEGEFRGGEKKKINIYIHIQYIQGVTGGTDQTSGGCSLC